MANNNCSGVKVLTCPICGFRYKRTNFMKRIGKYPDTHQIACAAKRKTQTTEEIEYAKQEAKIQ